MNGNCTLTPIHKRTLRLISRLPKWVFAVFLVCAGQGGEAGNTNVSFDQQVFLAELELNMKKRPAPSEVCLAIASRDSISAGQPFSEKFLLDPTIDVVSAVGMRFPEIHVLRHSDCSVTAGGRADSQAESRKKWIITIGYFEAYWSIWRRARTEWSNKLQRIAQTEVRGDRMANAPVVLYVGNVETGLIMRMVAISDSQF